MKGEYKKYEILSKEGVTFHTVYSTLKSHNERKDEIDEWVEKLAKSSPLNDYTIKVSDTSWSEATIKPENLFETHFSK